MNSKAYQGKRRGDAIVATVTVNLWGSGCRAFLVKYSMSRKLFIGLRLIWKLFINYTCYFSNVCIIKHKKLLNGKKRKQAEFFLFCSHAQL